MKVKLTLTQHKIPPSNVLVSSISSRGVEGGGDIGPPSCVEEAVTGPPFITGLHLESLQLKFACEIKLSDGSARTDKG